MPLKCLTVRHFLPSFQLDAKKQQTDKFIALFTLIYVAIGFVVFILIPAGIFAAVDYWSYLDSVYFAVISQTTVGFGDLVTGKVDDVATGLFIDLETAVHGDSPWLCCIQVCAVWFYGKRC